MRRLNKKELALFAAPLLFLGLVMGAANARRIQYWWRLRTTPHLRAVLAHDGDVQGIMFSPDGSLLVSGEDNIVYWHEPTHGMVQTDTRVPLAQLHVWNVGNGTLRHRVSFPESKRLMPVAVSPEGRFLLNNKHSFDAANGSARSEMLDGFDAFAFHSGNASRVYRLRADASFIRKFENDLFKLAAPIFWTDNSTALSPDCRFITSIVQTTSVPQGNSSSFHYRLNLWHIGSGRKCWSMELPGKASASAFAPDNATVITACIRKSDSSDEEPNPPPGEITAYNVANGQALWTTPCSDGLLDIVYSPNGKLIACNTDDGTLIMIFSASDGKLLRSFRFGSDAAKRCGWTLETPLAFSPDSKTLATYDRHSVQLWDVADLNEK